MTKLTRRMLLKSGAALAAASALPWWEVATAQEATDRAKNLVVVFVPGGWDTAASLDPKPGVETVHTPEGEVKTFEDISILTGTNRPAVEDFFAAYASNAAVLRGIEVRSIAHTECTKRILTGTNSEKNPDVGSIIGREATDQVPVPYMVLGQTAFPGPYTGSSGRVGLTGQLSTLLTPDGGYPFRQSDRFVPDEEEAALIREFVDRRADRVLQRRGAYGANRDKLTDYRESLKNSRRLKPLASSFGEQQFALGFGPQIDLGIRVLKEGISRSVIIQDPNGWDSHNDNDATQLRNLQALYTNLATLMDRLDAEDLANDTVVVVMSEMSRTPMLNENDGKDHWPVTSALILGSDIAGGRAYGGTTDTVESRAIDPLTGEFDEDGLKPNGANFAATVLELAGVDSSAYFPETDPIRALLG